MGSSFPYLTAAWVASYLALGGLHLVGWYKRYQLSKDAQRRAVKASVIGSLIYIDLDDPRCPERIRREYLEIKRRDGVIMLMAVAITIVLIVARAVGLR